jgi:organic radical activating enzyme
MKYYSGRTNLAATIFVPVKCGNNCKFCNTNILYKDFEYSNDYLLNILYAIDICNNNDKVNEFVITGGEPIMNLEILKVIVDKTQKPVFINTSLPVVDNIDDVIDRNMLKCDIAFKFNIDDEFTIRRYTVCAVGATFDEVLEEGE